MRDFLIHITGEGAEPLDLDEWEANPHVRGDRTCLNLGWVYSCRRSRQTPECYSGRKAAQVVIDLGDSTVCRLGGGRRALRDGGGAKQPCKAGVG